MSKPSLVGGDAFTIIGILFDSSLVCFFGQPLKHLPEFACEEGELFGCSDDEVCEMTISGVENQWRDFGGQCPFRGFQSAAMAVGLFIGHCLERSRAA